MTVDQIFVTVAGLVLAIAVIWYFFLYKKQSVQADEKADIQEINIRVKGGYEPDLIVVKAGKPVRLIFHREETAACSETVVFPDFRTRRNLPAFEPVALELSPEKPGEYEFHCGMNMLHGKLIAEE